MRYNLKARLLIYIGIDITPHTQHKTSGFQPDRRTGCCRISYFNPPIASSNSRELNWRCGVGRRIWTTVVNIFTNNFKFFAMFSTQFLCAVYISIRLIHLRIIVIHLMVCSGKGYVKSIWCFNDLVINNVNCVVGFNIKQPVFVYKLYVCLFIIISHLSRGIIGCFRIHLPFLTV
jgi:hypothetical protein